MELSDRTVEVHTALTIPDFAAYSPGHEALTCPKFLTIEGVRAKFLITVELFSSKRKGPPSSPRAPTRRDTPLGAPSTPRKASPMPRGVTRVDTPLRDVYTRNGIEEIIYGGESIAGYRSPGLDFDSSDMLDVVVEVACEESSVPQQTMRLMEIVSGIEDRREQERSLSPQGATLPPRWRGLLVPRISLKSYGLLRKGALHAWLRFKFPPPLLEAVGGCSVRALQRDFLSLLGPDTGSSDALLVTSDGGRLPAHLAILKARSNVLATCKILNEPKHDIGIRVNGRSPARLVPNLKKVTRFAGTPNGGEGEESSSASSGLGFSDSSDDSRGPRTPKKPKPSPLRTLRKSTPKSPAKKNLNQCFIECSDSSDESTLHLEQRLGGMDLGKRLGEEEMGKKSVLHLEQRGEGKVEIKVSMSSSVAKEVLRWIYSGTCDGLPQLSRPLLAAAKRYAVPGLAEAAERQLVASLDASSVVGCLRLAHAYGAPLLLQRALQFVCEGQGEIVGGEEWGKMVQERPEIAVLLTRQLARR